MLIYSEAHGRYVIDPHFLTIKPLGAVWRRYPEKQHLIGDCMLMWMYHMYNPRSPFNQAKNSTKSMKILEATFPKEFLDKKNKELLEQIEKANPEERAPDARPVYWEPIMEPDMEAAVKWYREEHLTDTPLWFAVESYKEAIYNTSAIIRNPQSSAGEIKSASATLDELPKLMHKMREQAEKDEAITLKVQGDKQIKRGERVPEHIRRGQSKAASNVNAAPQS